METLDREESHDGFLLAPLNPSQFSGSTRFILSKVITAALFLLSTLFSRFPSLCLILVLPPAVIEFWICKNCSGLELVGMRWSHEIVANSASAWVFYVRKDPYVPNQAHATVFWSGLFGSSIVWFGFFLGSIVSHWFQAVLCGLVFALELTNTFCFLKCHSVSRKQAEAVARSVMLGESFESDVMEVEVETPDPVAVAPAAE
jgi:hypothetical protein